MEMSAWLFTIEEELTRLRTGARFSLWTEPPRDATTDDVRRRADGDPYTPAWTSGDEIVVYQPHSGRCVAVLAVDGPPSWNAAEEVFELDTTVLGWRADGPSLAEIGVAKALQGGRHRLTPSQHGAARKRLA